MISRRLSGCRQSSPQARNTFEINQARDCPTRGHCRKRVDAAQIEGSPREINIAHRTRTGAAAAPARSPDWRSRRRERRTSERDDGNLAEMEGDSGRHHLTWWARGTRNGGSSLPPSSKRPLRPAMTSPAPHAIRIRLQRRPPQAHRTLMRSPAAERMPSARRNPTVQHLQHSPKYMRGCFPALLAYSEVT